MNHFPKKTVGAGAILRNSSGHILILDTTYNDWWHLPGGVVEAFESPEEGCIREVLEETALSVVAGALLGVHHGSDRVKGIDALVFVYDCGRVSDERIAEIRCQEEEIKDFKFVPEKELDACLDPQMSDFLKEIL